MSTPTMDRAELDAAITHMKGCDFAHAATRAALDMALIAAEAHLATLPKTKMVEVWRVEWAILSQTRGWLPQQRGETREDADAWVDKLREADKYGNSVSCIRVTGPHQQEVPA